ncbi:MAG: radical SAM protein [Oscillospiraceae bacterium]|nr:radical SAM protein [Oscillospiraceae bacterium]
MNARKSIIPIFVPHLGCPHDCVFCNQRRISGSVTAATESDVAEAVRSARERGLTPAQLAFYGGSFTAIPRSHQRALLSAAEPFLADGSLTDIRLSTRPDAIDADNLALLRGSGVSTIELGVQSMSDSVLDRCSRGHTAEDAARSSQMIKKAGFTLILQMMTGLPGSDFDTDIETAKRIIALRPDGVRIYPTVIIRGTALYDMWRAGEYAEHTVEDAVEVCSEILPLFERAGIPVIRLGLNPTDALSAGDAAAGAYHPALGEMVKSRVFLKSARTLLRGTPTGSAVTLSVPQGKMSQAVGQKRVNIKALTKEFALSSLKIIETPSQREEIVIAGAE